VSGRGRKWIIDGARTTARELARVAGRGGSAGLALRASRPARRPPAPAEAQREENPPPAPPGRSEHIPPSPSEHVDDGELARIRDELASELDRLASREERE
jgi:hypothetical protein